MSRGEPLIALLTVLRQLQACHSAHLGATLEELAESCELSTRTIRRKLQALESAGIEIEQTTDADRRKRYKVDPKSLPAAHVAFDPFEAAALYVANGMMAAMEGLPLAREAGDALDKVRLVVPASFREELEGLLVALRGSVQGRHEYGALRAGFRDLVDAVAERWPVEIEYQAPTRDAPRAYVLEPYLIHCHSGTVYVVGRVAGEKGTRTFALARVRSVRVRDDERFERDGSFDATRFVAESFAGFHEGDLVDVVVRFGPEVAPVIRERVWHPSQRLVDLGEEGVELHVRTAGPTGVLHWSKSYLPHVCVLAPGWLAERQRAEAHEWVGRLESAVR